MALVVVSVALAGCSTSKSADSEAVEDTAQAMPHTGDSGPAEKATQTVPQPSDEGTAEKATQSAPQLRQDGDRAAESKQTASQPSDVTKSDDVAETALDPGEASSGAAYVDVADEMSAEGEKVEEEERSFMIIQILSQDAILAIFNPVFITVDQAAVAIEDQDLVIGLSINGDHRAYSVPFLSSHEVVNDVVGGEPVAVTW